MAPSERASVAVFGGSFNPPHVGHVLAAAYVLACASVDRVLIVPTYVHPFAKALTPFADRLEMCRLAFRDLARVSVSDVEAQLGGESLTVRTLEHLHAQHPEWSMRLVVGTDVVHEMSRWTSPERVRELAPPLILARVGVAPPEGLGELPAVLPDVSSTAIRAMLQRGDAADRLLPVRVASYARERGLYRG